MKTRLILDINKTQYAQLNSLVTGRVGDKASNTVDVYVVDGFIPYNLTGSDVYFECAKPDNTSVRDKNGITMIDAAKGHFEYTFPAQTFASVGKSKQAYFTVEKNSTVKATTQDFIIVSLPDALTNRIPSQTYISQLEELIWQLEQIELDLLNSAAYREAHDAKTFAEQAKSISESVQEQLNQIVINGSIDPETKQARVDENGQAYPLLKERIDKGFLNIKDMIDFLKSDKINVLDYGAKGDGVKNDTNAIQAAINAAITKKLPLFFPNGTYLVSDLDNDHTALRVINATNFRMYGLTGATIKTTSTFWGGMFTFENCYNVEVTGITFEADGDGVVNTAPGLSGIRFIKDSKYIKINGNFFKGWTDSAITILSTSPDPDASGLNITDTTKANAIIIDNHFTLCEHCLITKYGGTRNTVISNNIVFQCCFGFKIDGEIMSSYSPLVWRDPATLSGNTVVVGNVFSEMDTKVYTESFGLGAVMFEENVENILVANNIMSDFRNVSGVTMSGGQGDKPAKNISIYNNKMTNFNTGIGISISSGVGRDLEDVVIEGNTFKNFNAGAMRIESKKELKGLSVKNNKFKDVCQNTTFLGVGYFIPSTTGIYLTNKTPNTYYAQDVLISNNDFMFTNASSFDELKNSLVIEGFKVSKYEDIRIENNYIIRPTTTTIGTTGIQFSNVDKMIFRDNYVESGRTYTKQVDILYKRNKFVGHRLSLGAGATVATPVTIEDSEFGSIGNGLNEYLKAENNTTVIFKNITVANGLYLTTLTGSTLVDKSQTLIKNTVPLISATFIGQTHIDTSAKKVYTAVSTGSGSSDWVLLN